MTEPRTPPPGPSAGWGGLVRPLQGRYVAGVCAGLGQATRTDPVLWRVVLAVLVCFGGIGALAYLALWLLIPEEGDTASPVQALLGRGESSTSPLLVAVFLTISVLLLVFILPRPLYLVLLGAAVVLVVLLLGDRASGRQRPPAGQPSPPGEPGGTSQAAAPGAPAWDAADPTAGEATAGSPADLGTATDQPTPAAAPEAIGWPSEPSPTSTAPTAPPVASPATGLTGAAGGYRPPFAPHGPFAGPAPPPPPPPPPGPRPRSVLPALTVFGSLALLGVLGILDLAGVASVPAAGYVAVALAATGLGLLVGTWWGRARSLVAVGLVLALLLPVVQLTEGWDAPRHPVATSTGWTPASLSELEDEYGITFGDGVLDLRQLDLAGGQAEVAVTVHGGEIRVLTPAGVAVTVHGDVVGGSVEAFGNEAAGLITSRSFADPPPGGPGAGPPAGELVLDVQVRFGNVEVTR